MIKLVCDGCGRTVSVDKFHGNEVCKVCSSPMRKDVAESANTEPTAKDIIDKSEVKENKLELPVGADLCGKMPDFSKMQNL